MTYGLKIWYIDYLLSEEDLFDFGFDIKGQGHIDHEMKIGFDQ